MTAAPRRAPSTPGRRPRADRPAPARRRLDVLRAVAWLSVLAAPVPSSGAADEAGRRVALRGEFATAGVIETLELDALPRGSISLRRQGRIVWRVASGAWFVTPSVCRDLASGRDLVVIATASGGSDGAAAIEFLAHDAATRTFRTVFSDTASQAELGRYFLGPERSIGEFEDGAPLRICGGEEYRARRERIRRAMALLGPPREVDMETETPETIPSPLPHRALEPGVAEGLLGALLTEGGAGFERLTLAEDPAWRIEAVSFLHFQDAQGVVLLEEKATGGVRSIFWLAPGDSKNYLLAPAFSILPDRAHTARVVLDPGSNAQASFLLDLRSLALSGE